MQGQPCVERGCARARLEMVFLICRTLECERFRTLVTRDTAGSCVGNLGVRIRTVNRNPMKELTTNELCTAVAVVISLQRRTTQNKNVCHCNCWETIGLCRMCGCGVEASGNTTGIIQTEKRNRCQKSWMLFAQIF